MKNQKTKKNLIGFLLGAKGFQINSPLLTKEISTLAVPSPNYNYSKSPLRGFGTFLRGFGGFLLFFHLSVLTSFAQFNLAPKVDYATGNIPRSVSIGDLTGDGKADIAVVNYGSSTLSIYTNTGMGVFASKVDYATGNFPRSVSIGDLTGDGKADIAVVNEGSSTLSIYTNTGMGVFASKVDYATGSGPFSVSIGDLTGDGKADIAVVNRGSNTLSIYTNTGMGGFATKVDYATGSYPISVSIGDLTGDGKADIAVANWASSTLSIYTNTGMGGFATKVDYATGINPYSVSIGDLTGDGKADIAVVNQSINSLSIYTNTGSGGFSPKVDYGTGSWPHSVSIGDLTGDGKADIAVVNQNSNTLSIYTNTGMGGFAAKVDYATGDFPINVSIGDLTGDGKADIAVVNAGSDTLSIYTNKTGVPAISSLSPSTIGTGQSLTLTGFSLNSTTGVRFAGGAVVIPTFISQTQIIVNVPCGAITGLVTLTGTSTTAISPSVLTITSTPITQIVTQPLAIATVCSGIVQAFAVSATGANLTYVWSNGLSTTNTMSTSVAGTNYRVTVSGTCGVVVSSSATLTTTPKTLIVSEPFNEIGCVGQPMSVAMSVTGTGPFNYNWNKGPAVASFSSTTVTGYIIGTVTGACGRATTFGSIYTRYTPPVFVTQPQNVTTCLGTAASFVVSATGAGPLNYTWSSGATGATLFTTAPGIYLASVTGYCGTVSSNAATFTGYAVTQIVTQPQNLSTCAGSYISFAASAVGANLTYVWSNNATTTGINTSVVGTYMLTVSGTCGSIVSAAATLDNYTNTQIITQPTSTTVCSGIVHAFMVSATGANLQYTWNTNEIGNQISTSLAGAYMVSVSGLCGTPQVSNTANLTTTNCTPSITGVVCATPCKIGNAVTFSGVNLSNVTNVCFSGLLAPICVPPTSASGSSVAANIPMGALPGAVTLTGVNSNISTNIVFDVETSINQFGNQSLNQNTFSIYPNPNDGTFVIETVPVNGTIDTNYTISTIEGKIIQTGTLSKGKNTIVTQLAKGFYLINVGGKVQKMIVE